MINFISKIYTRIEVEISFFYWRNILPVLIKYQGVNIPDSCTILGKPLIKKHDNSMITIGEGVVLCSSSKYTDLGVNHPVIIKTLSSSSHISIDNNTGMSGTTICCSEKIEIGKNCLIGANVTIVDTDFHPIQSSSRRFSKNNIQVSPVNIIDNVFIGANTLVLKGVTIGKNSIIGAGSVVTKSLPENVIAVGNLAKVVRNIE